MTRNRLSPPATLGEAIRAERSKRDWSQSRLARELETPEKNIRNWESGKHFPNHALYARMSLLFGWDLPYAKDPATARKLTRPTWVIAHDSRELASASG